MTIPTTALPQLSWEQVWARRLERHALSAPLPGASPAGIAALLCGAHAQIMAAAELSIALRLPGATRTDVRNALWREHRLVKTYGPPLAGYALPACAASLVEALDNEDSIHTRIGTIALASLAETGTTALRYDGTEAQRIIAAPCSSSPIYVLARSSKMMPFRSCCGSSTRRPS